MGKTTKDRYERTCPACGNLIVYKSYSGFYGGNKNNSKCKDCYIVEAGKNRSTTWAKRRQKSTKKYIRQCPTCDTIIEYKHKRSVWLADKKEAKCRSCYAKEASKTLKEKYESGVLEIVPPYREKRFFRECPICFEEIGYTTKEAMDSAIQSESLCNSCSTKFYEKGIAYNPNKESIDKMILTKSGFESMEEYLETKSDKELYYREVWKLTYKQPLNMLDYWDRRGPCGTDGAYQLDHKISISDGFSKNIDPSIIADISNLRMIPWKENREKGSDSIHRREESEFYEFTGTLNTSQYDIVYVSLLNGCEVSSTEEERYHIRDMLDQNTVIVFGDEWRNSTEIVKNRLRYLTNTTSDFTRIYARKCTVVEIDPPTKNAFLNRTHLQGADQSKIKLGLMYNGNLVSVMTFGNLSAAKGSKHKKNSYELSRFSSDLSTIVVGATGKLFSYFLRKYDPNKIISYADRRWSDVSQEPVYTKIGMRFDGVTRCNYWYTKDYVSRSYRFNFTKQKTIEMGGDPNKTEWENMQSFGYDRIWDCGHLKYVWQKGVIQP